MSLHSDLTPHVASRTGFDMAALGAGRIGGEDEVARLRAALETLVDLLVERGIVDAATLEARLGDLLQPPMLPVALGAPLPPPAQAASVKTAPARQAPVAAAAARPAPMATKPMSVTPAKAAAPVAATPAKPAAPVAVAPAPVAVAPAPVAAAPAPVAAAPAPVAAAPQKATVATAAHPTLPAPAPAARVTGAHPTLPAPAPAARVATPAQGIAVHAPRATTPARGTPAQSSPSAPTLLATPAPVLAPVAAAPVAVAAEPAWTQVAQRASNRTPTPVPVAEPYRTEPEKPRRDEDVPSLKPKGFLGGLFNRKKKPVAAIAAKADRIEFTERMPKMPATGLYADAERRTELAFPPAETIRKARAAAPRAKRPLKKPSPQMESPARFCDRCWRRLDATGICKTCPSL